MYVAPVFPCVNFVFFASAVYRGMCEATMLESGIKDLLLKPAAAFFICALQYNTTFRAWPMMRAGRRRRCGHDMDEMRA